MANLSDYFTMQEDPFQAALAAKLFGASKKLPEGDNSIVNQVAMDAQQPPPVSNPQFDTAVLNQNTAPVRSPPPAAVASRAAKTKAETSAYQVLPQLDTNPAFQEQRDALATYKDRINAYINKERGLKDVDLSPLMALAKSWNPQSTLADTYKAPESLEEHNKNATALSGMYEQRANDVAKTQADLVKDKLNALIGIDRSNKEMSPALDMMRDRLDNSIHQKTVTAVKNDPVIRNLYQGSRNIANALSALDEAKVATPQQFAELQQGIRKNLGITGTSGVEERDRIMLNSLGVDTDRVQQYLFGQPTDITKDVPEFIDHLKNLVQIVQRNNMMQMQSHLQSKMAGNKSFYQRRPDLANDLQDLGSATTAQFQPQNMAPGAAGRQTSGLPSASAPGKAPIMTFEEFKKAKAEGRL